MPLLESFGRRYPGAFSRVALGGLVCTSAQGGGALGGRVRCLLLALFGMAALGCGNAIYAVQVSAASSRLEEARELRADELAPYEYTMAFEHLQKARSEAAEADYGDAIVFAEVCEEYSVKAIRVSQEAHRSAGR